MKLKYNPSIWSNKGREVWEVKGHGSGLLTMGDPPLARGFLPVPTWSWW